MSHITVSLQAPPTTDASKDSLQHLIACINEQKGSFRNVTEESLLEEIKRAEEDEAIELDDDEAEAEDVVEDEKVKKDTLSKARGEMLKQVGEAQQQSQITLDLVSLLLSQRNPGSAGLTLSPIIKQTLPMGSVTAEVLKEHGKLDTEVQQDEAASMGWRMQSLNKAAGSLLSSASRLEKEMEKEAAYWDQVLAVKEKGWSLSRLPREKHTLGVHYGFTEAHSSFRDRGLAALRMSLDGSLGLDRGANASKKRLRLRKLCRGEPVAIVSSQQHAVAEGSVEQEILAARNSIYDEELFFELNREAQKLTNQGVKRVGDALFLHYENDTQIEIALEDISRATPTEDDQTLSIIMQALRLSLSQAHLQNLHDRSQPPAPMREGTQPRPVYPILKPIIEVLQHRAHLFSLRSMFHSLQTCLSKAGLSFSFDSNASLTSTKMSSHERKAGPARTQALTLLISSLTSMTFTLHFVSQPEAVEVHVSTSISSPSFGTSYRVTNQGNTIAVFHDLKDLELELCALVQNAIKQYIKETPSWKEASIGVEWVSRSDKARKSTDRLAVDFGKGELRLEWQRTSGGIAFNQGRRGEWVWSAESIVGEERDLMTILQEIVDQ